MSKSCEKVHSTLESEKETPLFLSSFLGLFFYWDEINASKYTVQVIFSVFAMLYTQFLFQRFYHFMKAPQSEPEMPLSSPHPNS